MGDRLSRVLLFLAAFLLVLAVVAGYVRFELLSEGQFADRATQALADPDVRAVVGREITDRVILRAEPDLVAAKPLLESAVAGIVGSPPFLGLFEDAVDRVHASLLSGEQTRLQLDLRDAGILIQGALNNLNVPQLDRLPTDDISVRLAFVDRLMRTTAETAHRLRVLIVWLIVVALAFAAAGIWLSTRRRRAVQVLAGSTALVSLAAAALLGAGRVFAQLRVGGDDVDRAAAGAVFSAFFGDLVSVLLALAAFATVVAAAAATQATLPDLEPLLHRARRMAFDAPRRTSIAVLRALALIVAGTAIMVEPLGALRVAGAAFGLGVLYIGVGELLRVARDRRPTPSELHFRDMVATALPATVILVVALVGIFTFLRTGGATAPALARSAGCNGSVALCDKRLDEVILPATHNAMSASDARGWYAATQHRTIPDQLRAGTRALLIDAHYGIRVGDAVRTDLSQRSERAGDKARELYVQSIGQDGLDAISRIRDRAIPGDEKPGVFLCHRFCELGAVDLTETLREILQFLVERPREVLVIVIEDYVLPDHVVDAFRDSGLINRVYTGPPAGPFPTLGEMVEDQQQVVVYAENFAGGAPWYTRAYDAALQETPFSFQRTTQLTDPTQLAASCRPNRGTDDARLFLMNHWINTDPRPLPSHAAVVNRADALLARAAACRALRGKVPNLLAVDFEDVGDLYGAAADLNRALPQPR